MPGPKVSQHDQCYPLRMSMLLMLCLISVYLTEATLIFYGKLIYHLLHISHHFSLDEVQVKSKVI